MFIKGKKVYINNREFVPAILEIKDEKIIAIHDYHAILPKEKIHDYNDYLIIPGFIDLHVHGWARGSFWGNKDTNSLITMSNDLAKVGVTSFLATTGSDSLHEINQEINAVVHYSNKDYSDCIGIHLEGPFLNSKYKGMQPENNIIKVNEQLFDTWVEKLANKLKIVTIAPEFTENLNIIAKYKNKIKFNAGHTDATYEQIDNAINNGLTGITHTFSGQRGFHHRELGVAGAAMIKDELYVEVAKQTGLTIHPDAFKILYRLKPEDKFILTSDAVGYGAYPVGKNFYNYIRKIQFVPEEKYVKLIHDNGDIELIDKADYDEMEKIEISFNESVKNILNWHSDFINIQDIIRIAAENPAKYINVYNTKGSISINKDCDIQIIDEKFNIKQVYCRGKKVYTKGL